MIGRLLAPAFLLVVLGQVAQADDLEMRRLYDHGLKAYNLQEFRLALGEFSRAYVEKPDPVLLFNIGQAQRQLGMFEAASRSYRAYLAQLPTAGNRDEVAHLAQQMVEAAQAQRAARELPPPSVQAASPAPELRAPPPRRSWYRNAPGIVVTAGGLVVGVAGAALLGVGARDLDDAHHAATLPDQHRLMQDADRFSTAGWAVFGVGAAALVTGVVILAVRR